MAYAEFKKIKKFKIEHDMFTKWFLFILESGTVQYNTENQNQILSAGEFLLCSPYSLLDKKICDEINISIIFYTPSNEMNCQPLNLHMKLNTRMESTLGLLKNLQQDSFRQKQEYNKYIEVLLLDIWYQICMMTTAHIIKSNDYHPSGNMWELLKYIDNNLDKDLSLPVLAEMYGSTVQTLIHRIKELTSKTPCDYITELRINKVKKLLCGTCTLRNIALECGFSNEYYLSNVFKKSTGMTPSCFRREHTEINNLISANHSNDIRK
jgi:YesN/AraC family two-component response regulator